MSALESFIESSMSASQKPVHLWIGNEPVRSRNEAIYRCVRLLANKCDGARNLDGIGFNRLHAGYGHYLADKPFDLWTSRELYRARRMLETYKNTQLKEWWETIPKVENPDDIASPSTTVSTQTISGPKASPRIVKVVNLSEDKAALRRVGASNPYVVQLHQSWNGNLVDAIKMIPGRAYDPDYKRWLVPITIESTEVLARVINDYDYELSEGVNEAIESALQDVASIAALSYESDASFDIKPLPQGLSLKPFQLTGVRYAVDQGNIIFGDEMGLGKTVQALATIHHKEMLPAIIICPASIKDKWANECRKWLPGKRVIVLNSRMEADLDEFDVMILNYDIMRRWIPQLGLIDAKCIVCDEAHKLKNPGTMRVKNAKMLFDMHPDAQRLFLTGTALVNRVMELGTLLTLLGKIDKFGGLEAYKYRYDIDWSERRRELGDRVRAFAMIRRLKKDVLSELEDKQYDLVPLDITNRDEYEEWELNLAQFMAEKKAALMPFDKVSALKEAMDKGIDEPEEVYAYIKQKEKEARGEAFDKHYQVVAEREALLRWEQLKQVAVKGKKKAAYEWLDEFLEEDDETKIVVFGTHTEFIHEIADRYNCDYIDGSVKVERRQAIADAFQNDPSIRMIVGNINAMGEGLDLYAASHVAFVELGWSPKDMKQAEDRLHRIGQKNAVIVHYLVAENTIENEIAQIIEKKVQITEDVLEGNGKDRQFDIVQELMDKLNARASRRRR